MKIVNEKRAVSLGLRIGTLFLTAVVTVIIVAYFVLSQKFQSLLTDYSIKLVQAMTDQGVKMVEIELDMGRREATFLADSFLLPNRGEGAEGFPEPYEDEDYLRMVYVTENETVSSDGKARNIRDRADIRAAFAGETEVYGPYFNEDHEFVVCYSAPVRRGDEIVGAFSVEKDGYLFCEIIKNIRFIDSGESYIINAEGTDIAVSDPNHIDWVNTEYNAQKIFDEQADEETKKILDLERNGLNGETGLGTYYWQGGLCYVFYKPIPSMGWVLLAGMREEELAAMTRSAFYSAASEGPVLGLCLLLVVLTALIIYWIISSMKQTAEINEKLRKIANHDSLTGLMNRNSYHAALEMLTADSRPWICIYLDVNGLHELNNHLGHQAGDKMLKAVADSLCDAFPQGKIYRIGGDEFVVLCWNQTREQAVRVLEEVRQSLGDQDYSISIGIAAWRTGCSIASVINEAEAAMQADKRQFYEENDSERRRRSLNRNLEKMIKEKQDTDTFLSVLASDFNGVYFVNLSRDTVRHLFIPPYFEDCLETVGHKFSQALLLYANRYVKPEFHLEFELLCNYVELEKNLVNNNLPVFVFQKKDGTWLKLQILKFKEYTNEQRETLWIFSNTEKPAEKE